MKKSIKFSIVLFLILTLLIGVLATISEAAVTKDSFKTEITDMFNKEINIDFTQNGENQTTNIKKATLANVGDSKIELTYKSTDFGTTDYGNVGLVVDYSMDENKLSFTNFQFTYDTAKLDAENAETLKLKVESAVIDIAIISLEKANGGDMALAYSYLRQELKDLSANVTGDVFTFKNEAGSLSLDIDLARFVGLSSNSLTSEMNTKISFYEARETTVQVENKAENVVENKAENKVVDNTTAPIKTVPKAGIQFGLEDALKVIIGLAVVGIIVLYVYNKNLEHKD